MAGADSLKFATLAVHAGAAPDPTTTTSLSIAVSESCCPDAIAAPLPVS